MNRKKTDELIFTYRCCHHENAINSSDANKRQQKKNLYVIEN